MVKLMDIYVQYICLHTIYNTGAEYHHLGHP